MVDEKVDRFLTKVVHAAQEEELEPLEFLTALHLVLSISLKELKMPLKKQIEITVNALKSFAEGDDENN